MTTYYVESSGTKRKFIAPLVVLTLCVVALTGSAFAYSTQVTGHGDISGNYVYLDLYKQTGDTYTVTSDFQYEKNTFKVYTKTDQTVKDDTTPYKAYVDPVTLTYYAYIKINASEGLADQKFTLSGSFVFVAPSGAGTILVDGTASGSSKDISSKITVSEPGSSSSNVDIDKLEVNKPYLIKFTLDITGAADTNLFGSYASQDAATAAVTAFNSGDSELTITLSASPTSTTTPTENSS